MEERHQLVPKREAGGKEEKPLVEAFPQRLLHKHAHYLQSLRRRGGVGNMSWLSRLLTLGL